MRLIRRMMLLAALPLAGHAVQAQECTPTLPAANLISAGTLQMAINPTPPPQRLVDADGELQGLNIDLMREAAKRLCVSLAFVRMDFPPMFPALAAARFDGIDTGMFWTEERSKIAYTVPYAQQAISVTVPTGSILDLASADAMAAKSAGFGVNSCQERWLRGVDKEITGKGGQPIDIRTFTTATDVIAALRAGQVETAILIGRTAREIVRRGIVKITATGLGGAPTTLVSRNKDVAEKVAVLLTAMRADGFHNAPFDRYGLTKLPDKIFPIRGPGPGWRRLQGFDGADFLGVLASPFLLRGALVTAGLAGAGMVGGLAWRLLVALSLASRNPVASGCARGYIWFFRGTPLLIQLVMTYSGLPQIGTRFGVVTSVVVRLITDAVTRGGGRAGQVRSRDRAEDGPA